RLEPDSADPGLVSCCGQVIRKAQSITPKVDECPDADASSKASNARAEHLEAFVYAADILLNILGAAIGLLLELLEIIVGTLERLLKLGNLGINVNRNAANRCCHVLTFRSRSQSIPQLIIFLLLCLGWLQDKVLWRQFVFRACHVDDLGSYDAHPPIITVSAEGETTGIRPPLHQQHGGQAIHRAQAPA